MTAAFSLDPVPARVVLVPVHTSVLDDVERSDAISMCGRSHDLPSRRLSRKMERCPWL
jgi:hypothetical protein